MVEHVGKRGLKAHAYSLRDFEDLGEAEAGRGRVRSLENADSGVAEAASACGSWGKRRQVEELRARLASVNVV